MENFSVCFQDLEDPRHGNAGLHDLLEILVIALCTTLCGGKSAVDMQTFERDQTPRSHPPRAPPPRRRDSP